MGPQVSAASSGSTGAKEPQAVTELPIYLDGAPDGPWMGHLLSEVGCIWLAPTKEEATARAAVEIAAFFAWLREHGEPGAQLLDPADLAPTVADVQEIPGFGHSGGAVGLFPPDHEPLTDAHLAAAVRRLGYARRDLLQAVTEIPPEALDWAPLGGKRTVRENLVHVHRCHGWYLTRVLGRETVGRLLPEPWPEELFTSMKWVMEGAVSALLNLPPALRTGRFMADRPAEEWTPRKMVRRFVEHEREHLLVVWRTIASWRATQQR